MSSKYLSGKKVVVWGVGKEGISAGEYILKRWKHVKLSFIDENKCAYLFAKQRKYNVINDPICIQKELASADVVVKSPGVSLYHPYLEKFRSHGGIITSLLDLWISENPDRFTIGVTGTKGKSTTSTLLAHVLNRLGKSSITLGNIGIPVTEVNEDCYDFYVLEISSYQAASLTRTINIAILTNLYPEHIDWHRNLKTYYSDKCNILSLSKMNVINMSASSIAMSNMTHNKPCIFFNHKDGIWHDSENFYYNNLFLGTMTNSFLKRNHNMSNACGVLAVVDLLGLDVTKSIVEMESYQSLPHRQQYIGKLDGVSYVDDSISTTPESTVEALRSFSAHKITLILGGYDRGIDYSFLVEYILDNQDNFSGIICLDKSGEIIYNELLKKQFMKIFKVNSMAEAVKVSKSITAVSGAIILSPAAPSYGMFTNYIEKSIAFVKACGL